MKKIYFLYSLAQENKLFEIYSNKTCNLPGMKTLILITINFSIYSYSKNTNIHLNSKLLLFKSNNTFLENAKFINSTLPDSINLSEIRNAKRIIKNDIFMFKEKYKIELAPTNEYPFSFYCDEKYIQKSLSQLNTEFNLNFIVTDRKKNNYILVIPSILRQEFDKYYVNSEKQKQKIQNEEQIASDRRSSLQKSLSTINIDSLLQNQKELTLASKWYELEKYQQLYKKETNQKLVTEFINYVKTKYENDQSIIRFQSWTDRYRHVWQPMEFEGGLKIPHHLKNAKVSSIIFPYLGKATIRKIDINSQEIGSYGYIYQRYPDPKPGDEFRERVFTAEVKQNVATSRYEVYCDGEKLGSITKSIKSDFTTFEGNGTGGNIIGNLLSAIGTGLAEKVQLEGFDEDVFMFVNQDYCLYRGDDSKKGKIVADKLFADAKQSILKKEYIKAVQQLEGAIWANNDPDHYEALGDLINDFGCSSIAFTKYTKAAHFSVNNEKLAKVYFKLSRLLSNFPKPVTIDFLGMESIINCPELSIVYLKKATSLGNEEALNILSKYKTNTEILNALKNRNL